MKALLRTSGWLLLVLVVVVVSIGDEPVPSRRPDDAGAAWFEVVVEKPRSARAFGGLLPEGRFGIPPAALWFDHASPGAAVVDVAADRLALRADGWEFVLELGADGGVASGTHVVFPVELAERARVLRGLPATPPVGEARLVAGADGAFEGEFTFELPTCEDAETGKPVAWPSQPLTVRGSFAGLGAAR